LNLYIQTNAVQHTGVPGCANKCLDSTGARLSAAAAGTCKSRLMNAANGSFGYPPRHSSAEMPSGISDLWEKGDARAADQSALSPLKGDSIRCSQVKPRCHQETDTSQQSYPTAAQPAKRSLTGIGFRGSCVLASGQKSWWVRFARSLCLVLQTALSPRCVAGKQGPRSRPKSIVQGSLDSVKLPDRCIKMSEKLGFAPNSVTQQTARAISFQQHHLSQYMQLCGMASEAGVLQGTLSAVQIACS
jgi:hypothetical protein